MANVNIQQNYPNTPNVPPQSGTQGASGGGSATFQAGLSAVTITALLSIMEDMMKLSILNGDMMIDEVNAQNELGQKLCEFDEKVGDQQLGEYMAQGITGALAGVITIGAAVKAYTMTQPKIDEAEANLKGAQSYKEVVNESKATLNMTDAEAELPSPRVNDEVDKQVTGRLKELKAQSDFTENNQAIKVVENKGDGKVIEYKKSNYDYSDRELIGMLDGDELDGLSTSLDEKVNSLTSARDGAIQNQNSKLSFYSNMGDAVGKIPSGIGLGTAGAFKKQEQDLQGQVQAGNAAMQIAQGVSGQLRGNVDKYMNEVGTLTQIMGAISKANQLGG